MPVPATNIKMSDLQNEFGGTYPISISEYYRDPTLVLDTLQNNQTLNTGSQRPVTTTSNSAIPTSGTVQFGDYVSTKRYSLNYVNYGGTGGRIVVPPGYRYYDYGDLSFSQISGNLSEYARYGLVVHNISLTADILPVRLRVESADVTIQGWFSSGGFFGDDDYSYIGNPGYRITDPNGNILIETYAPAVPSNYNDLVLTLSAQTAILTTPGTYTLTIFAEAMFDEQEEIDLLANMIWPVTTITHCTI